MNTMTVSPLQSDYVTRGELRELKDDIVSDVVKQNNKDMKVWREKVQGDFTLASELILGRVEKMEENILQTVSMNIHKLEKGIDEKLDTKPGLDYFDDYLKKFENKIRGRVK